MKQLHAFSDWYGSESLLLNLWEEGLATYVSYLLNPQASYAELALDFPKGLFERVWEQRTVLANDLASKLSCKDEDVYEDYFIPWTKDKTIPGRAGYFIGFTVISELAKQYPLTALLQPRSEEKLFELFETQLTKLAELPNDVYLPNPPVLDH